MRYVAALLVLAACSREPEFNLAGLEEHATFYSTREWQYEYQDLFDGSRYVEGLDSMTGRLDLRLDREGTWQVTSPDPLTGYFWIVPYVKADTARESVVMFGADDMQDGYWFGTEREFHVTDPEMDTWLDSYCEWQRPEQVCQWVRHGNQLTTTMSYSDSLVSWSLVIQWQRDSVQ